MHTNVSELSVSVRDRIILLKSQGLSYRKIAKDLKLIKRYEETGHTNNKALNYQVFSPRAKKHLISNERRKGPNISAQLAFQMSETLNKALYLQTEKCFA